MNENSFRLASELQQIVLRPLQKTDNVALANLANNKNIWNNIRDAMPHPYTEANADFFIDLVQKENPNHILAIESEGVFCGLIGLHRQNDVYRLSAELGYWIGEPFWGKGIGTKAVELMVKHGFENLELNRIYAGVYGFNLASMHVLEKCGFEKEGILRKAVIKNNIVLDEHRYAIFP
jgi:[ribosomal protein S5]-alanine N-acetyltransferase